MKPAVLGLFLAVLAAAPAARGQVFARADEALRVYYPGATVERKTVYLTEDQLTSIRRRAQAPATARVVTYYRAVVDGRVAAYGLVDTRTVKTLPATVLVVIEPNGAVRGVDILAFYEPEDHLPTRRWLRQFEGKSLRDDLLLRRGVHNISGATLSAQTIADGVRCALALFDLVLPVEH